MDQYLADEAEPSPQANSSDLLTQLVTGPSMHEVASSILYPALTELYPDLAINPDRTLVVKPTWLVENAKITVGVPQAESLTDALVRHGTTNTPVTYLDGEHFLTVQPKVWPMPHLPVRIDVVGQLMNELIPLLFVAYQEHQLDYWNQQRNDRPRWHELAESLRAVWNVSATNGWDADQQALARLVFDYPDSALRASHDTFKTRVCLVDIDHLEDGISRHRNILELCVIIGTTASRTMILTHSVIEGFGTFDSLEGLNNHVSNRGKRFFSSGVTQWRLYEPDGDFFQAQACTMIALQGQAIAQHDASRHREVTDLPDNEFSPLSARYQQVENHMPDWLLNASPVDQTRYSRLMMDLALAQQQNPGQTFLEQVPPIGEYTLKTLRDRLLESHPDATGLNLQNLRIEITSVVVWGTFVPGTSEKTTFSLVDLALENLIAVPLGSTFIYFSDGAPVPEWMTADFIKQLITDANIGQAYPALLKQRLLDDPVQSKSLQTIYTRHLKIQLSMLALQLKLCNEGGLDDLGCRYITRVFEEDPQARHVGGQEIVIRPLAFVPNGEDPSRYDTVSNMYVIEPRDPDQGPCLLYRPLMDNCLLQYPTRANLIYAIKHSHRLRKSILAWLPDNARANYTNFIFPGDLPSVWTLTELLANPVLSLQITGPVKLGTKTVEGDRLAHLFKSNARALVELADRQSVSNAESHWASLKQGAWKLFNGVLPFLGPTLGTAAWIWQIMDDVQEAVDAVQESRQDQLISAVADLFLNIAVVLAHHAATRNKPAHAVRKPITQEPETTKAAPEHNKVQVITQEPVKTVQAPDLPPAQLPSDHALTIHASGALNGRPLTLSRAVAELKVEKPEELGEPIDEEGPEKNLYRHEQRLYAPVGKNWFEVEVDDYDNVQIIDSRHTPKRRGPLLTSSRNGKWYIDIRLRLRGGGLSSRRMKYQQQKAERVAELLQQLAAFDRTTKASREELTNAHKQMAEASADDRVELTRLYLEKTQIRSSEYEAIADKLEELNRLDHVPHYRTAMVDLLRSQLFLNQAWFDDMATEFNNALHKTLETMEQDQNNDASARAIHQRSSTLITVMINRIAFSHTTFAKLTVLGKEGAEVIRTYTQKLPVHNVKDLKAFQVVLGQELCLKPETTRAALDVQAELNRIVDSASLAIETSQAVIDDKTSTPLDERIEALNEQVERFTTINRQLGDVAEQSANLIIDDPFKLLRERINAFSDEAADVLGALLRERKTLLPVPGPSRIKASAPKKKVIKTRMDGIVAGEERTSGKDNFVDVKAPVSGKTLATYHQKPSGEWLKRVSEYRARPAPKVSLANLTKNAQHMLDGLERFINRYNALADGATYLPVEIDEAFQRRAAELSAQSDRIDEALGHEAGSTSVVDKADAIRSQLQAATTKLFYIGHSTRVRMIMQRDPTAAHVEWLKRYNEIGIVSTGSRRRLKGQKKDFLQEYEIRNRQSQEVLWYAHFHYDSMEQADANFIAAHLKTREQRKLGGAFDLRTATNDGELLRIYRSEISPRLADQLFFKPGT
ncbi:DUF6543 domain-containing protein [Pseudomonas sp. HMWF021]|uniref:DUF6543 domain-containing protein n=1 Tax=Pseudomonas sp. HMWF021 TaxID=2056857 RepID=UPI000D34C778|nr:DUF6543 domain-containing protein [Pseudomonas sp. HMWF021]PTT32746.1 hypothetical protein DBR18_02470 [Pseudomonas sp. HMWF021]